MSAREFLLEFLQHSESYAGIWFFSYHSKSKNFECRWGSVGFFFLPGHKYYKEQQINLKTAKKYPLQ